MDGVFLIVFAASIGVLTLGLGGVWLVLLQIVQQQGRILIRLDELAAHGTAGHTHSTDELPVVAAPGPPAGVAVGSPIGDFELPDVAGQLVQSGAWRGQRTLLVHWNTTCGFCELIAPDLAKLQPKLRARGVQLILASYGEAETNRRLAEEYGLGCRILLQPETQPIAAFQHLGTPVAYVLDDKACVSEPLVAGADSVLELAGRLAAHDAAPGRRLPGERPLSESHIERNGLRAGTRAPSFNLPDIHGTMVSLDQYRGRRVLLVFTDPHCGPCDELAPHLPRLHRPQAGGVSVVVIGRGDAQENARKAEQFEFAFPVALQKHWEVSRSYGIFATPVAFLIDEDGVIARDVAMGVDAILTAAGDAQVVGTVKER